VSVDTICFVSLSAYGYFVDNPEIAGGGAQRQFYLLSRALSDDYNVHVIVGDYGQPERVVHDGVTLHRAYKPDTEATVVDQFQQLHRLAMTIRSVDAGVYISRGNPRLAGVVWALVRLFGGQWLYHVASDGHIETPEEYVSGPLGRLYWTAITHADAIVVQTDRQNQVITRRYGQQSTVIPNGYPPAEEIAPQDDREFVLWIGRLEPDEKRPDLFVELAEQLPETAFRMLGPWEAHDTYRRRLADRIESTPNLTYEGAVEPEAVYNYYDQALACVNTSAIEGFPNTFLEAWRAETVVVSLAVDPGRFIDIDADWTGFADGSMDTLTQQVREITTDETLRKTVAQQCREQFEQRYSVEALASKYRDLLALLGNGPSHHDNRLS